MDTKQAIVRHLEQHPGSSRSQVAEALGIDALTASRELRKLVRGGTLTMSGSRRGAKYSLARAQEGAGDAQSGEDVPPYHPAA
jgi:predicted ArsR family transcriptional regulator